MIIKPNNFFSRYVIYPTAPELDHRQRMIALVVSIAIGVFTLGIVHLISFLHNYWKNRQISLFFKNQPQFNQALAALIGNIRNATVPIFETDISAYLNILPLPPGTSKPTIPSGMPLPKADLGSIDTQEKVTAAIDTLISQSYALPFPHEVEVKMTAREIKEGDLSKILPLLTHLDAQTKTSLKEQWGYCSPQERLSLIRDLAPQSCCPPLLNGEKMRWSELSKEQKVLFLNFFALEESQKVFLSDTEEHIDSVLFGSVSMHKTLPQDPREHHGCDHASRTALWSGVFAHLYTKYCPTYASLSNLGDQIALCQIIASGHDMARQTEGVNIFNAESAKRTAHFLRDHLGIQDQEILTEAKNAILHQCDPWNHRHKSFIAKCIQCAGSTDFARRELQGPKQTPSQYLQSESFLDIYKEMRALAIHNLPPNFPNRGPNYSDEELASSILHETPGGNLTYGDFLNELRALKREMNQFIFLTHRREERNKFVQSGHYFHKLCEEITSNRYPMIFNALQRVGIKGEQKPSVPHDILSLFEIDLRTLTDEQKQKAFFLAKREKDRLQSLMQHPNQEKRVQELDLLMRHLEQEQKSSLCESQKTSIERAIVQLRTIEEAKDIEAKIKETLQVYHTIPIKNKDPLVLTSCAFALQRLSQFYINQGESVKATELLIFAGEEIKIDALNPLSLALERKKGAFFHLDTDLIRRGQIRLDYKKVHNEPGFELSFALRSSAREQIEKQLIDLGASEIPATFDFEEKSEPVSHFPYSAGWYRIKSSLPDHDWFYCFPSQVEVRFGKDRENWTEFGHVRLRFKENTSVQEVQKALAAIGLPAAILPSRPQDVQNEAKGLSLAFRHPDKVYKLPRPTFDEVFNSLSPSEQEVVLRDIANTSLEVVGDHLELTNTSLAKEAWSKNARAFGAYISSKRGNVVETARTLAKILKNGLLSVQDRAAMGLFGGCVPGFNMYAGSGDQVFTRMLGKATFEHRVPIDAFAVEGPILLLADLSLINRCPYSYFNDRGGMRNPYYYTPTFSAGKQWLVNEVEGSETMRQRATLDAHTTLLDHSFMPCTETMFSHRIPPHHLCRAVVKTEADRQTVLRILREEGIEDFNGVRLEEAIVASKTLKPSMIPNFYSRNYPTHI